VIGCFIFGCLYFLTVCLIFKVGIQLISERGPLLMILQFFYACVRQYLLASRLTNFWEDF